MDEIQASSCDSGSAVDAGTQRSRWERNVCGAIAYTSSFGRFISTNRPAAKERARANWLLHVSGGVCYVTTGANARLVARSGREEETR